MRTAATVLNGWDATEPDAPTTLGVSGVTPPLPAGIGALPTELVAAPVEATTGLAIVATTDGAWAMVGSGATTPLPAGANAFATALVAAPVDGTTGLAAARTTDGAWAALVVEPVVD
ncbi:MAG: hypothetical protein M3069_28985 [Chloroflexota bacterium]|nr:hypothetical protein [Chloroflexota bacterium]